MKLKKRRLSVLLCAAMLFFMMSQFAVAAAPSAYVETLSVTLTEPAHRKLPATKATAETDSGESADVTSVKWYLYDISNLKMQELSPRKTFVAQKIYKAEVTVAPKAGSPFSRNIKAEVNGEEALCVLSGDGSAVVTSLFTTPMPSFALEVCPVGTEFYSRVRPPMETNTDVRFHPAFPESDVVTITGSGRLYNPKKQDYRSLPWHPYRQLIREVVFGWGITEISKESFGYGYDRMEDVQLPVTLERIGDSAFRSCGALTAVDFPKSLQKIGAHAFENSGLHFAPLPICTKSVGEAAFRGCKNMVEITIPSAEMKIGSRAFADCTKLTTVNFHGTEEEWAKLLESDIFDGVNMEEVHVNFLAPHVHSYDQRVVAAATCKEEGSAVYTCDCGDSYTQPLDKIPHTYDPKKEKVVEATVTAEGYTENTCTVCGEAVKSDITPKRNLPEPEITGVTAAKGKKITVKWKKSSLADGYQVQLSTSKSFGSGVITKEVGEDTTSATFSGLSKDKTYYARVRCTAKGSGETVYSGWSGVKNVKAKK